MTNVSKPTINQLLIVNVILMWTFHDYNGLVVMSSIFSSCIFYFLVQNAFVLAHFCKLYHVKYKK
jgi:hypothetical protein